MSEFIYLEKDGSSIVVADCLLKNTSKRQINSIRIIYPNTLYTIKKRILKSMEADIQWSDDVGAATCISDISETLTDASAEVNWAYRSLGLQYISNPENPNNIILAMPPLSELNRPPLEGILNTSKDIRPTLFTPTQLTLLHHAGYTILTHSFNAPLGPDESIWMRLQFKGKEAAYNLRNTKLRSLKRFANQLSYKFRITGPDDVKEKFLELLTSLKHDSRKDLPPQYQKNGIKELADFFWCDGLLTKSMPPGLHTPCDTVFRRLLVHITHGTMKLVHYNKSGNVNNSDNEPYIIKGNNNSNQKEVYKWSTTYHHTDKFTFSIVFETQPTNIVYYYLGWAISLSALTLSILNFIHRYSSQ